MNIKISLLNVKDGDAIIVHLQKKGKDFVMLIDGGRLAYGKLVIEELQTVLDISKKKGPDLVVCTHYDSDHIGGLIAVVSRYGENIGEVWIQQTQVIMDLAKSVGSSRKIGGSMFPSQKQKVYQSIAKSGYGMQRALESIKQEAKLIDLIKALKIPHREPIRDNSPISSWPEIRILGPTSEYYHKNFPKKLGQQEYLQREYRSFMELPSPAIEKKGCDFLNDVSLKRVSPVNLCSAILLITIDNKKFLFTGDGGVASFENIPDYQTELADIYWLKVPHHASSNNISCHMIDIMKPKNAFVSGDKYIDQNVIDAFAERNVPMQITRDSKTHIYFQFP